MNISHSTSTREFLGYAASCGLAALLFAGDLYIPRGATPAIGYCVIPVLAAVTHRCGFLRGMTIACTALTWLGYVLEPKGLPAWMSAFDRIMVTGALWLIFELVRRRLVAIDALAGRTLELEAAQRELERSNAELDRFASMVAHDIRGPLGTISLFSQMLDEPVNSKDDIAQCAGSIRRQINSLTDLIQKLLAYGKVGGGDVKVTSCDCNAVLDSVRLRLKALLDGGDARLTNDPLPTLGADPTLLAELFQNLVENAIKYRGVDPPRIHVSAQRGVEGWRFSVGDNGIGIAPDDLERIFHPFRQAGPEGSRRGVGLGLATCKRIVERHGGQIEVSSTPGQGSTFSFTLGPPAAARPSAHAADSHDGPLSLGKKTSRA